MADYWPWEKDLGKYAPEFAERQPRGPPPQPVPASDFVGLTD